jgi:hypothetical protein
MKKKSITNLGREKVLLWMAIFGFLKAVAELVIKVVSYARQYPKLQIQLSPQK